MGSNPIEGTDHGRGVAYSQVMKISRIGAVAASLSILFTTVLVGAPAAQAGISPPLIAVTETNGVCGLSSGSVMGNPGRSFTIASDANCLIIGIDGQRAPVSPSLVFRPGTRAVFTLGAIGSGVIEIDVVWPASNPTNATTLTVNVQVVDTFIPEPQAHDYLQQVGVPASGTCADVSPEVGHFRGFPIGGWSKSWARWINDGTGGPVCTREVEARPDGTVVLIG